MTTHRAAVGVSTDIPAPKHGAHEQAGAVLLRAEAQKQRIHDEALCGHQNEKAVILGIETGGRMHKHFYQLLDIFAKLKADADAGPLGGDTDPVKAKYHKMVLACAKTAFVTRF